MTEASRTFRAQIGSLGVDLPVVDIGNGAAVALLMTIDHGVGFIETVGRELADLVRDTQPDIVATAATLGIPVALEVSRALGLDDYVVLQKSRKIHLGDAWSEPVRSITSHGEHVLLLDRARTAAVAGRRVLFVDDVLSTGSSARAALTILERAGADVVGAGFLLEEGTSGRESIVARGVAVHSLGTIPLLEATVTG
jgi:adenine/guanine phosphoribosyltransferase-like PRPP-binding protein